MFGIDGVGMANHRYSAQALDTTAVCAVDFEEFEALFPQHLEIQRQFTAVLCAELYTRQQPLLRLRQYAAEERLSAFLLDIAERVQKRNKTVTEFSLPMPRRDIARYLCLAEETLSRLFRRLQDRQLLEIHGRKVVEFDQAAFRKLSATPVSGAS
jgi:CRP/FNR family transcriptional regulator